MSMRFIEKIALPSAAVLFLAAIAQGQMAAPVNHPGASITAPTSSILLTPSDITTLQTWWNTPAAGFQTTVKSNVVSYANQTPANSAPNNLSTSETMSRILQAKALRWAITGGGNTSSADFIAVRDALTNYAKVTGGSGITGALSSRGFYQAFDLINSGLTSSERSAIISRLNSNVLSGMGSPTSGGNQEFLNRGMRAFYAQLAGNESNLDTAMGQVRNAFTNSVTNDGFQTEGDRYMNYFLANLSTFMVGYVNNGADATGAAQYKNAAVQMATYGLAIRMPNGTSPSFHNSDNMPLAIHELSRLIDSTQPDGKNLKAAVVWNAEQLNGHDWTSWANATNNNWTITDFMVLTDYADGAAAPNWSPTYLSDGQSKIAVFKNDWGKTSNYLAITGGTDGGSFTHQDTAAITLVANGTQVLVEPGYARYNGVPFGGSYFGGDSAMPNTPAHSGGGNNLWTNYAIEHNVLLARTNGTSTWGMGNNADSQGITGTNTTMTNRLDAQERGSFKGVMDFSTVRTTYGGAGNDGGGMQERRSIGMVNESATDHGYMVMTDAFRTTSTNKDFALNLIGKSTAANTQIMADTSTYKKIRWSVDTYLGTTSNNVSIPNGYPYNQPVSGQVIAHIVASTAMDAVAQDSTWMVENYGSFIQTQRMRISTTNQNRGTFLTLFETGAAGFTSKWTVTPMSGTDYAAARIVSTDGWNDWHISQTNNSNVLTTAAGVQVSIDSGALSSDAQYAYLRRDGSSLNSLMISRGTNVFSDGLQIIGWNNVVTASLLLDTGGSEYRGSLSADDLTSDSVLTLYSSNLGFPAFSITSATLNGTPMAFTNDGATSSVTMAGNGGGDFVIYFAVPEPASFTLASLGGLLLLQRRRSRR
ncbi:MAG: hypothetical protein IT444_12200 [Phycisphaeraceae bacterium]|nr:hypothetical protein [Phycisphaeraceae bacterium]